MSSLELYPDPPHLMIQGYSLDPEAETFAAVCRSVEHSGRHPSGVVETLPWPTRFTSLTDVAGQKILHLGDDQFRTLTSGQHREHRPVRAGFRRGEHLVVVEYGRAPTGELHPIIVATHAGLLGLPEDIWDEDDRASAEELASWSMGLLAEAVRDANALYAAIDVERSLPTPAELADGQGSIGQPFISQALIDSDPTLLPSLRTLRANDEEITWPSGHLFTSIVPFRTTGQSEYSTAEKDEPVARLIGSAALRLANQTPPSPG
jgi:hypothetical protein